MKTITDRLKDLIRKNGGDPSGVHTIEEAVGALELSGGGSGGVFVVDVLDDENSSTSDYKTNATAQEIYDAFTAGLLVQFRYETRSVDEYGRASITVILRSLESISCVDTGDSRLVRFSIRISGDRIQDGEVIQFCAAQGNDYLYSVTIQ